MSRKSDEWDKDEHQQSDEEHVKNCPDCQKASKEVQELAHTTWHNVCDNRRCFNCVRDATYCAISYVLRRKDVENELERNFQIGEVLHGLQSNDFRLTTQVLPCCDECEEQLKEMEMFDQEVNGDERYVVAMTSLRYHNDKFPEKKRSKEELAVDNLYQKLQYSIYDLISDMKSTKMTKSEIIKNLDRNYNDMVRLYWTDPSVKKSEKTR